MSYTINLTDGAIFAVIPDGTINTSSSMTLVGKNYAGYGQFLDTNFVHLLENSSNTTPPGAPLTGQLWWDSGNNLLQVYNGSQWKTISSATSSATAPTGSNVEGDLWYDSTNQQLKVWTSTTWLLIGPNYSSGTGVTGAFANVIVDTGAVTHKVIQLVVNSAVVGIVSEDAVFTPQSTIPGFANVNPGLQLASTVNGQTPQFWGNSSGTNQLNGLSSTSFMRTDANTTTTGTVAVNNNTGLTVGASQDFRVSVASTNVTVSNQTSGGNIAFVVNVAGTPTTALTIFGANGTIQGTQITAQYADVAERFEADTILAPGTVVELGGSAEITQSTTELSDKVFGVISTRAAYLMNSSAGSDATHPAVAMTGRVPVRTVGTVYKGDRLVSAGNGLARAAHAGEATAFNVIGRALQDKLDAGEGTVEAIVTIK